MTNETNEEESFYKPPSVEELQAMWKKWKPTFDYLLTMMPPRPLVSPRVPRG